MRKTIVFFVSIIYISATAQSGRKITRKEYIETFKDIAMNEMSKTGIPASITLAQGIIESGDGNSTLARKANNHFGIKCHGWEGKTIRHDDDAKNECFRKYKSADESYHDHSEFLTTRGRYSFLFDLEKDDYKGWAKGLKKAGYATSPTYANALIRVVEANELYKYDKIVLAQTQGVTRKKAKEISKVEYAGSRQVQYNNRVKYVVAREGDTFDELSEEMDLFAWQLPKYNELDHTVVFGEGDIIYLQPKRNKAEAKKKTHTVKEGETMHSISQIYAVKESKLRERNGITSGEPKAGEVVLLRGKAKNAVSLKSKVKEIDLKEEQEDDFQIRIEELDEG